MTNTKITLKSTFYVIFTLEKEIDIQHNNEDEEHLYEVGGKKLEEWKGSVEQEIKNLLDPLTHTVDIESMSTNFYLQEDEDEYMPS